MPLTDTKPQLSRQYVYLPLSQLNVDLSTATLSRVAFKIDPAVEPVDADWRNAIIVTSTNGTAGAPHNLYRADVGDAFAILVGPLRGDVVTTEDLAAGEYLCWSEWKVPDSDEYVVDWHGSVTIVAAPGVF